MRSWLTWGLVAAMGACCGCGTGEYERRLEASAKRLSQGSAIQVFGSRTQIGKTRVSVQLPPVFANPPLAEGDTVEGGVVGSDRLTPPVYMSNLDATFEGFVQDSDGGKMPVYVYVGVIDPIREALSELKSLRIGLSERCTNASSDWENVQCLAADGSGVEWKRMQGTDKLMLYYVDSQGRGDVRSMEATIEILTREQDGCFVTLMWSVPSVIAGEGYLGVTGEDLPGVARLTAGAVRFEAAGDGSN